MMKLFNVLLFGTALSLAGSQPSYAGSNSFLGGAIAGGVGVMLFQSLNNRGSARSRRRVMRRRHPAAAQEPRMSRQTKMEVQDALNQREFAVGVADGSFGGNTRRGIRKFQSSISASVTGYLTQQQVTLLLDEPYEPPRSPVAERLPAPTQPTYNPAPLIFENAQTFESLAMPREQPPIMTVASREYSPVGANRFLEDAPQ